MFQHFQHKKWYLRVIKLQNEVHVPWVYVLIYYVACGLSDPFKRKFYLPDNMNMQLIKTKIYFRVNQLTKEIFSTNICCWPMQHLNASTSIVNTHYQLLTVFLLGSCWFKSKTLSGSNWCRFGLFQDWKQQIRLAHIQDY